MATKADGLADIFTQFMRENGLFHQEKKMEFGQHSEKQQYT